MNFSIQVTTIFAIASITVLSAVPRLRALEAAVRAARGIQEQIEQVNHKGCIQWPSFN